MKTEHFNWWLMKIDETNIMVVKKRDNLHFVNIYLALKFYNAIKLPSSATIMLLYVIITTFKY